MKHILKKTISIILLIGFCACATPCGAKSRQPAVAGIFYPETPQELTKMVNDLTFRASQSNIDLPKNAKLRALIMPHAGYQYSGLTAAHAATAINNNQFDKIIIIGPDHHAGFYGCAISDVDAYETPLAKIKLHPDTKKLREQSSIFKTPSPVSTAREHSLEVMLPFLQVWGQNFSLVPMIAGNVLPQKIATNLESILDNNTLVIASSDLSHYLPYDKAITKDKETIDIILSLEFQKLVDSSNRACGHIPIKVLMLLARKYNWTPFFIHYSNSGDTAGTHDRVVGYTAIAFYGGSHMAKKLTRKQGQALITLAQKTISERLGMESPEPEIDISQEKEFQQKRGTFVTLTLNGELRGCIGSLTATESILTGIKRNAINAAFHDTRFSPMTKKEVEIMAVEISILTEPQPLEYSGPKDLLEKLCPDIDGVIIKKGLARATFLPQVWTQLPTREEFLSHLCTKAGLAPNAWEQPGLEVLTYQVQYFESKH